MSASAHVALTNLGLLQTIVDFQRGIPLDLLQLARRVGSNLAKEAIDTNDFTLLLRVYRYHQQQPWIKYLDFAFAWWKAVRECDVTMLEWFLSCSQLKERITRDPRLVLQELWKNKEDVVLWVVVNNAAVREAITESALNDIARKGYIKLFTWLCENVPNLPVSPAVMDTAAEYGHLDLVKYLHEHRSEGCTTKAMDRAAYGGHLDVVRFLHENRSEGCTTQAMNRAALADRIDVVRFLHENRSEGFDESVYEGVVWHGYREMDAYLYRIEKEKAATTEMDNAAAVGDLDAVQRLYEAGPKSRSKAAIDRAAFCGHVEVVRFLHVHRLGPTQFTAQHAIRGGHLDVLTYLIDSKAIQPSRELSEHAALWGVTSIAQYLHENFHQFCSEEVLCKALHRKRTKTATYWITHCDAVSDKAILNLADIGGVELLKIVLKARPGISVQDALSYSRRSENTAYLTGLLEENN